MDGLDLALTVPLHSDTPVCEFDGRCPVNLAGTTLAVVEDLTLYVSFDLILPADADTAPDWQVYLLLQDNSRDYDGSAPTGRTVCFHFWPNYFSNSLYWSQISQEWKDR